jgi:hypothetical protein
VLRGSRLPKAELNIAAVPPDPAGQLAAVLDFYRALTGREPTPAEAAEALAVLTGSEPAKRETP